MAEPTTIRTCPLCLQHYGDEPTLVLTEKGAKRVNISSNERGDNINVSIGTVVHVECRKKYTSPISIKNAAKPIETSTRKSLRKCLTDDEIGPVSPLECLFCTGVVNLQHQERKEAFWVRTDDFIIEIRKICHERSDEWGHEVLGRINFYGDLHARDCIYHQQCSLNFRTGKEKPKEKVFGNKKRKVSSGRPVDDLREEAFRQMCEYFEENDDEQQTIAFLTEKCRDFLPVGFEPYSRKYVKEKLAQYYGKSIYICTKNGVEDLVTMRDTTQKILRDHYKSFKDVNEYSQKLSVLKASAMILRTDIKSIEVELESYPKTSSLNIQSTLGFLPEYLRFFLDQLFPGKNTDCEVAGIGHALIQSTRPKAIISPLQIGLAVQLHYHFRSRFLIDTLYNLGFCSSYSEVLRFEENAANCRSDNLISEIKSTGICLFAADNVDHNIVTLNGHGVFHGMGMIAMVTPQNDRPSVVPRRKVSDLNVVADSKIDIIDVRFATNTRDKIKFDVLKLPSMIDIEVNMFWKMATRFKKGIPDWNGMMHLLNQKKQHPGPATVQFLPMIDLKPSDESCIFSTLSFLNNLTEKNNIGYTVVTFDQPLYWKACDILHKLPDGDSLKNIVVLLGSFHTLMNVLGAIGHLMSGSGIRNLLEVVYGENAVTHILTGKAVDRAVRGYMLLDNCLNYMIVDKILMTNPAFQEELEKMEVVYESSIDDYGDGYGQRDLQSQESQDLMKSIVTAFEVKKDELCVSKTAKLWFAFQRMMDLVRYILYADRTGDWEMHLNVVQKCLPLFASAGHYNYLKSAYHYITHPVLYSKFMAGYHVVRRGNKFWSGLGCDCDRTDIDEVPKNKRWAD